VIAVGSLNDDGNGLGSGPGSVYLYDAQSGTLFTKILADDATTDRDQFGRVLDIDNGILAVGAFLKDDQGSQSGATYLFNVETGEEMVKLLPTNGDEFDQFGHSIAIENGMVVVGSYEDDDIAFNGGCP